MRKIIVEVEMSLDGCIGGEDTSFWEKAAPLRSDDVQKYLDDILFEPDALLMGDKTYKIFAEVWPKRSGKAADYINKMPKYVASRNLAEPLEWNASLLKGDVVEEIKKLKDQPGTSLVQYGVGELTRTMLEAGLIDEIRILVLPFTYGEGARIFDHMGFSVMKLIDTRTFDSGAVALRYQPQNAEAN